MLREAGARPSPPTPSPPPRGHPARHAGREGALVREVKKVDGPAVTRLLDEGANHNAMEIGDPPPTLARLLKRLLARLRHQPDGTVKGERKSVLALRIMRDDVDGPDSSI